MRSIPAVIVCVTVCATACGRAASSTPVQVRVAAGPRGATFFILANAIASVYTQRISDLSAQAVETRGTSENLDTVENGEAECGLGSADLVYEAYLRGTARAPAPHTRLRGVAVLFPNTLHVVTRAGSGNNTLADLAGKKVAVALPGDLASANRSEPRRDSVAAAIAELSPRHERPQAVMAGLDDAVRELELHQVDAAYFYGGYPFRPVTDAAQRYSIQLVEFDELASSLVKARYPFLKPVIIPGGTYRGQDIDIRTMAVDNVLICRSELSADLVYRLTLALYDGLSSIASVHASARQISRDNGAATPIPLHEGATRYYRERELFR
jgi:TRAP transporter TAXI family solute receptor